MDNASILLDAERSKKATEKLQQVVATALEVVSDVRTATQIHRAEQNPKNHTGQRDHN